MTKYTPATIAARETIAALAPWQLAGLADVAHPDAVDSPGAVFLTRVRDDVVEALAETADALDETMGLDADAIRDHNEELLHEIADGAPSVYTHTLFQQLVDLAAYHEDVSDLVGGDEDMTKLAAIALYIVAERLVSTLVDEYVDALPDDVEADDDAECECSESYRHRGEHTPGCPMDDGERAPLAE